MRHFLAILVILLLYGCDKSGYSTRINLSENAGATKRDILLITNTFKSKPYDTVMTKEEGSWGIESYKIKLPDKKFNDLQRNYIGIAVEYWCPENTASKKPTCKMEVRIGNPWEGKKPILKTEIDKITDLVVTNLSERLNMSEVKVQRAYTSPM